jgi:hypothetical protein
MDGFFGVIVPSDATLRGQTPIGQTQGAGSAILMI